jgi:predicted DNA-binding transcriptional regulator AlpA
MNGHAQQTTKQTVNVSRDRQFLTEAEVEAHYGIARRTLQRWRLENRGPRYRKFGRSVRYKIPDLEAWVDSQPTGGECNDL